MKIFANDGSMERKVLIWMITSKTLLARVSDYWDFEEGPFKNSWCNIIGGWCVRHYRKYQEAPGAKIEHKFASWAAARTSQAATRELIETFLTSLSEEQKKRKPTKSNFEADSTARYFDLVQADRLIAKIENAIDLGTWDKERESILKSYKKADFDNESMIDPINDPKVWDEIAERPPESLIRFGDTALGKFFGHTLSRGNFVCALAPMKRGKSLVLLDLAFRAVMQRVRVMFFQSGDMSRTQVNRRLAIRTAWHPMWPGAIRIPSQITVKDDKEAPTIEWKTKTFKHPLGRDLIGKGFIKAQERIQSSESFFKMQAYAGGTLTVSKIRDTIDRYAQQHDWVPDIIVIDHSDLLTHSVYYKDPREKINQIWLELRGIPTGAPGQPLLLTATQANRPAINKKWIDMADSSEDIRKAAHVSAMFGINQTKDEKSIDLFRLNWLARREDSIGRNLYAAGCTPICHPLLLSCFEGESRTRG